MLKYKRNLVLDLFDYAGNKLCSLYDQTSDVFGQAYDVVVTTERNGWKEISFSLPQNIHTENGEVENFRIPFIREGYRIRLIDDNETDWFILSESKITHNNYTKVLTITAGHVSQLLKHKRLDLEFSDEEGNNVGTAGMLLTTILEGTGWSPGYVELFLEKDKSIKYRSLKASSKTGAFKLIANMCDLFEAKPIYHGDTKTVDIVPLNPFSEPKNGELPDVVNSDVVELHYGTNVRNVSRTLNEENLITKLYAYGSYGEKDTGYCGIDECTHHVYRLVVGSPGYEPGTECMINFTDAYGYNIIKYFTINPNSVQNVSSILYSDLDPASRMYVWDEQNNCAYFLYDNKIESNVSGPFFSEDISARKEEPNLFSFLMDFNYYKDIGLLTDDMLQTIADYQHYAPEYMQIVGGRATTFADELTTLSETIGSVNFCKLDCTILKQENNHLKLRLNSTSEHPRGVIYRTDYTVKEDKQFKWRVATELKENGDPVHNTASVVYIVYEPSNGKPLMFDKSYLKEIDNEDNPSLLTLWLDTADTKYTNQNYRVYLFAQNNINGVLGSYESTEEALITNLNSTVKNITINHPVFFEQDEPTHNSLALNGYGWWWKWYSNYSTPSELYFCWNLRGDNSWKRVLIEDENPGQNEGYYWYNWKTAVLWRKDSGAWIPLNDVLDDKNMSALFGTVLVECQRRDSIYKGIYQKYIYTASSTLPIGNYAFKNTYGSFMMFTTDNVLSSGDTLTYDTTQGTITQKVGNVETVLETRAYRFDNVRYHSANVLEGVSSEAGGIDSSSGADISGTGFRTNMLVVYPNTEYTYNGYNGDIDVYYYDENRNYLGHTTVFGMGESAVTPGGRIENTEVGELNVGGTRFIKLVTDRQIDENIVNISTPNYINKVIAKDYSTYVVLDDLTTSGELKGIISLVKKFADAADKAYGIDYSQLKSAQDEVRRRENLMTESLGDLYREGFWQKNDYVDGDEQKLYDDALDNLEKLSKPEAKYEINYLDLYGANIENNEYKASLSTPAVLWPDITTASAAHLVDPEIGINTWAFVDKVQKCYDQPWKTKISINTNLTTISQHSFADVMSHIAEVSSETKGKMSMYDRAGFIMDNGYLAAERLQGKIDANKLQITGGSSTWYTDDNGNMVFESSDGTNAMTITGNGFAIANSKDKWGDWNWRTFGTGEGFTADELTTGFLSAERLLAGSITASHLDAGVGGEIDISANKSIKLMASNMDDLRNDMASITVDPNEIAIQLINTEIFEDTYVKKEDVEGYMGYRLEIVSDSDILSNDITTTTLTVRVLQGNKDVTDEIDASRFAWKRKSSDDSSDQDWNNRTDHSGVKSITVNARDVAYSATYTCELTEEEEEG